VLARGNAREHIYRDDGDYESFLAVLADCCERYEWCCYAYCLMGNHYHLVVETPRPNLSLGMRQLNGVYARRYNRRHGRCGHVFQARYRSILVEKESHLLALVRYVALNPVRAGLCDDAAGYCWSSYAATAGLASAPRFLATDWILSHFATSRHTALERYRAFVEATPDERLDERVQGERLGGDEFLRETFGFEPPLAEIPRAHVQPVSPALDEVFESEPEVPVLLAYRRHGYTLAQIAEHLGCHYSTVSRRLRREEAAERRMRECKT
jgi:REP element-mobilizing transposase RayT